MNLLWTPSLFVFVCLHREKQNSRQSTVLRRVHKTKQKARNQNEFVIYGYEWSMLWVGAVEQEGPGVHSAPHTDPIPSGSRGQRLPQTTQMQLGKAEDQRCTDPGVKYKVAESGGKISK